MFRSFELSRTRCVSIVEEDEGYVKLVAKTVAGCDQMYKCVRKLEISDSFTILFFSLHLFFNFVNPPPQKKKYVMQILKIFSHVKLYYKQVQGNPRPQRMRLQRLLNGLCLIRVLCRPKLAISVLNHLLNHGST